MKAEQGEENEKVDLRQRTKDFALRVIRMFKVGTRFAASFGRDVFRRVLDSTRLSRPRRSSALPLRRIDRNFRSDHQTYQTKISSRLSAHFLIPKS